MALKILVVGFGSIGKRHTRNLLELNNIEIIICTKQKDITKKYCRFFSSLNDAIADGPDAAIIANNTSDHIKTAIQLSKHGIHILIEKPLSNNLQGINVLTKLVKQKKLITLMGCNLRFHQNIIVIKELIQKNSIGKIISVQAESGSYLPDWHPDEDFKQNYSARDDLGGGVVLTCIHEIDYLYWFFGKVDSVFSITGQFGNLGIKSEDLSAIILKFKNGVIAELHLDYIQKPEIRRCKIIGTKGKIYWDSDSNIVKLFELDKNRWTQKSILKKYERNNMYKNELLHFIECVKKRKNTINPIKQGVDTMKVSLAVKKSSKLGRLLKI